MPKVTTAISMGITRAKEDVYKVLDTLDALEKKATFDENDRDRLSARVGKLGEDAWFVEQAMDQALDSTEET